MELIVSFVRNADCTVPSHQLARHALRIGTDFNDLILFRVSLAIRRALYKGRVFFVCYLNALA